MRLKLSLTILTIISLSDGLISIASEYDTLPLMYQHNCNTSFFKAFDSFSRLSSQTMIESLSSVKSRCRKNLID